MLESLNELFQRDLLKMEDEVRMYPSLRLLWETAPGTTNSGGTLALHVAGNLQHFIGAVLGSTGYVRNREAEFGRRDVPAGEILAELARTRRIVSEVLKRIDDRDLAGLYPIEVFGVPMSTEYFLIHLQGHLNYHLGQVNYHRRILTGVG